MSRKTNKAIFIQLPSTIWAIGIVSLLVNLSSIVIFSLYPLYITQIYGLTTLKLGLLEGVIESFSCFTRIFSGVISDYIHKRKPLLIVAYTFMALARLLFAVAPGIGWIYGARFIDRMCNGLQATPREALVSDVAPPTLKGACYGLRQTLGLAGSLMGAVGVMYLMRQTGNDYEFIFLLASIPTVLGLVALLFFIKEPSPSLKKTLYDKKNRTPFLQFMKSMSQLPSSYWKVIWVAGLFLTSNYSGVYMILQAEHQGLGAADVPLVMVLQNLCAMLAAYPIGRLSDAYDRRILLGIGFLTTILANFFMGLSLGIPFILLGASLWGVQMGINQSLLLTKVADTTLKELRGTAFGIYYFVNGIALFIANSMTGWLFENYGTNWAFIGSSIMAGMALIFLPSLKPSKK